MIDTDKRFRWMTNNLLEAGYALLETTSVADDFTILDALDGSQRTKVFRFGGRFLIEEDVNDKIYVDGATYTIPAGEYNSADDLAAIINSLTFPAEDLACLYSPSEKHFIFSADAAATLNLSNTTEAAWQTLGFATGVDIPISAFTEVNADAARIHWPYEEITIDFGYQATIGFVGIIGDLSRELKIPQGAEIRIMGNTVDSFVSPPLDQVIPWYPKGAFKFIDDVSDSAWRYVKIRITCPTASEQIEFGYLYVGDYSTFPVENVSTGFELEYEDNSDVSAADDGQIYVNDKTPLRYIKGLDVGLARKEAAKFLKEIYLLKQLSVPFFVALDPKQYLSEDFDEYLMFCRFTIPPKHKHILRDIFQLSFELKEVI